MTELPNRFDALGRPAHPQCPPPSLTRHPANRLFQGMLDPAAFQQWFAGLMPHLIPIRPNPYAIALNNDRNGVEIAGVSC